LELIEIKTKIRTTTGNGPARRLRMSGQIPAVLYGPKTEAVLLSVNKGDLELRVHRVITSAAREREVLQENETESG
jgi:ribosomal protein L25 (general stress protein Ctc)